MEFDCKMCVHEKVCDLWLQQERQDASCFCLDGCDYFEPTLTQPNEPLTLEELREMDGQPVWVVPRGMHEKDEPMWCVLESPMALIPGVDYWSWDFDGYEETWIAYRRPPEEEA